MRRNRAFLETAQFLEPGKKDVTVLSFLKLANHASDMILQLGRASPYYGILFRQYLEQKLFNVLMSRSGPVLWHARSPDLTNVACFTGST